MTYSRARELFLDMLIQAKVMPATSKTAPAYGLHSPRSGGVAAALQYPGVSGRLVQRHGG